MIPPQLALENAICFSREADGLRKITVGTIPPIRVEGASDVEAIRNMLEVAESIKSGCMAMLGRCNKGNSMYEGRTVPVQPFQFKMEDRK